MNNTENIIIRKYEKEDLPDLIRIWNQVVEDGVAFPQEECPHSLARFRAAFA